VEITKTRRRTRTPLRYRLWHQVAPFGLAILITASADHVAAEAPATAITESQLLSVIAITEHLQQLPSDQLSPRPNETTTQAMERLQANPQIMAVYEQAGLTPAQHAEILQTLYHAVGAIHYAQQKSTLESALANIQQSISALHQQRDDLITELGALEQRHTSVSSEIITLATHYENQISQLMSQRNGNQGDK